MFEKTFNRDETLARAREVGATQRLRDIHPADVGEALVECALGDEQRSIATARRRFDRIAGFMPEESAFYKRFNRGFAVLMKDMYSSALEQCSALKREVLANVLDEARVLDLLAVDASQVALPSWAAKAFPSTNDGQGGIKLTATFSVLKRTMDRVIVTDARQHDRRALRLPRWLHDQLYLMDRGYCDRKLFAAIEDRKGFFIVRLKKNNRPTIARIRGGLEPEFVGEPLTGDLPFDDELDIDAKFKMPDGTVREFRIVRIVVPHANTNGTGDPVDLWFVTNLTPEQFSAEQIATLYRFRWEIEKLFQVLKTVARLDHLRSANPNVIAAFVFAALIAVVLAMSVCSEMRRAQPWFEPSLYRVTALTLGYLPEIAASTGTRTLASILRRFERALWREGINPNPGRPFTRTCYEYDLAWLAAERRVQGEVA
jgi:putative transposase